MKKLNKEQKLSVEGGMSFWSAAKGIALFASAIDNLVGATAHIVEKFAPAPDQDAARVLQSDTFGGANGLMARMGMTPNQSNIMGFV